MLEQAPPAIAPWIDFHVAEPERAEIFADRRASLLEPGNPGWLDLEPRPIAEMPDPQVARDAQGAQIRFALLDLFQARRRDRQAVLHPARETGSGRRIPRGQTQLTRGCPDLGLRHSGFGQRGAHAGAQARGLSGPV